jgi:hypothetical protein
VNSRSIVQCTATSLVSALPVANEEIASTTVHRATLPIEMQRQGTSVPAGSYLLKGITAPAAGFQWSGVAPMQADRTAVVDRNRLAGGPGPAARGRPV